VLQDDAEGKRTVLARHLVDIADQVQRDGGLFVSGWAKITGADQRVGQTVVNVPTVVEVRDGVNARIRGAGADVIVSGSSFFSGDIKK